ncbi:MAG: hydratase [Christensenellales bacterium]|jgi:aconitate hydratase
MKLYAQGAFLQGGQVVLPENEPGLDKERGRKGTLTYNILQSHNTSGNDKKLKLRFDSLTSHDITYVGIIQTARASGMKEFPMPYVLTNCHNSLCAVGGTINEDDHDFALSAAKKYGGIYVPTNLAVIHSYNREEMSGCGRMILGSDSHTRYGALGTISIGEGGGELAKQLLNRTYDVDMPEVVGIYLYGTPRHGVGPQDIALALIKAVFDKGFVKNRVMEFIGPGIAGLPVEYRNGIDVMTTETTCLSSIWVTDDKVHEYYKIHGREDAYQEMTPQEGAFYDRMLEVDLGAVEPMIALPFHPSNAYPIREFLANAEELLKGIDAEVKEQLPHLSMPSLVEKLDEDGNFHVDQGIVAGCSGGTYDNVCVVANIIKGHTPGNDHFTFSVYPGSQPANLALARTGVLATLLESGVLVREAFCGPCFGAGDTPANGAFSVRHTTRNFINREGSKPNEGQLSYVALMDARSIAATARNGGILTPADEVEFDEIIPPYHYEKTLYERRVFKAEQADPAAELIMGPNIKDWPAMPMLKKHLLIKVASSLLDPVTTTDELIPSGETSSYRSNPLRLAEFTLSRRDPGYVGRAKQIAEDRDNLDKGQVPDEIKDALAAFKAASVCVEESDITLGSGVDAVKPGDGSAREQAASCQRVLGGAANFAREYATKRYRSNLINWGIFPFLTEQTVCEGEYVLVPDLRQAVEANQDSIQAYAVKDGAVRALQLRLGGLTKDERQILLDGCLINYYKNN